MNSGKVRIYELSRELNLDNKDILAVCEQLNISVKSHSSTITDSEAELIKTAAEKYAASHPSATKPTPRNPSNQSAPQPVPELKTRATAPVQKKQQIVAIKSVTRQPSLEPPTPPSYAAAQAASSQNGVTAPAKPADPAQLEAHPPTSSGDSASQDEFAQEPSTQGSPVQITPEPELSEQAQGSTELVQPEVQPEPAARLHPPVPEVVPSELVAPPPRSDKFAALKPNLTNRPILKRARIEQPDQAERQSENPVRGDGERSQRAPSPVKPSPVKSATPGSAPARPAPGRSLDKPTPRPQQQTIVELRRPKPVRPDGEAPTEARAPGGYPGGDSEIRINRPTKRGDIPPAPAPGAPGDDSQALQPRPTLPRTVKKGKDWDEEEETPKTAKAATKTKRRVQPELDEDEELEILLEDGDDEDGDSPMQVSLSLVRPAKPKSMRPPTAKPPTMVSPRSKKSSSPRDRRDRREQESKIEKPEKIILTGSLTVQELSAMMLVPDTEIIRTLFMKSIMATVTQTLDVATATMVAQELGIEVETAEKESAARKLTEMIDVADLESLQRRPPVVTIMGHVDHGKTSLLDYIRKAKVAQGEAGGITQHIGAYHVDVPHNGEMQQVVFLDTPGHEAFTAMRARGARVTDVAILVVAADDGVQPQTIEAISHAKAAEVPIIIAINKIDKEGAQPDRVKQELTEYGLVPEEWGGETIMVPVSAMTGENVDTLLEMILLVTEVEELSANPDRSARGTVIEAHLDKAKGPVATLIVQNGTLRVGDVLVAGSAFGKVRAMVDDRNQRVKTAGPSYAVEVLGLADVPAAGDEFAVFKDEKEARAVSDTRSDEQRQSRLLAAMSSRRVSLNTISERAQEGDLKELNLVLKADVQGSVEAILSSLKQLPQKEVQVRVLYAAPGEVTETDVDLAAASSAVIIGFNTTLATGARQAADRLGVDVRDYNIIYNLLDDIQAAMEGLLEPEMVEEPLGQVEVRAVFPVGRGAVAGCYILSGKAVRNCKIRVRRGSEVVFTGALDSLKRMKEDAKEVNTGFECGVGVDNFNAWEVGDIIETYRMISKRRTLSK